MNDKFAGVVDIAKSFTDAANRPTIGFDIDDTSAQRVKSLLTVLNVADGGNRRFDQVTSPQHKDLWPNMEKLITKAHETPGFYGNMGAYSQTRDFMWMLSRAGFHIIIATKRDEFLREVTMQWLAANQFPQVDDYVFGNNSKYKASGKYAKMPLVFIDDDPRNLFAFDRATTKFIMPIRPWNAKLRGRQGYNVVEDYNVVLKQLGLPQTLDDGTGYRQGAAL